MVTKHKLTEVYKVTGFPPMINTTPRTLEETLLTI